MKKWFTQVGISVLNLKKVSTIDKIQAKLNVKGNMSIQELYCNCYEQLRKIYLKYSSPGSEEIEGLIGLGLLSLYLEYWNEHNLKEHFDRITSTLILYEKNLNDDILYKRMSKLSRDIFKDYMKFIGVDYED